MISLMQISRKFNFEKNHILKRITRKKWFCAEVSKNFIKYRFKNTFVELKQLCAHKLIAKIIKAFYNITHCV